MSFIKDLFSGKQISEEEQARRMGKKYVPMRSLKEMSEEEQRQVWLQYRNMPDLDEREKHMIELTEVGFIPAYTTLLDTLFERARIEGTKVPLDQLEYWSKRAAEAGNAFGHYYLGCVYETPEYLQKDFEASMEKSLREYLLAMGAGIEAAAQRLVSYWNPDLSSAAYSDEEMEEARADFRADMLEWLKPELNRLREQNDDLACRVFGQMYFYGIIYEQDLAKAKMYFSRLAAAGDRFGSNMLANPLFEEDEEE